MNVARMLNNVWMASCRLEARRFARDLLQVRRAQQQIFRHILRQNADTAYGRAHGFDKVESFEEYRRRVPITSYEKLAPWLQRVFRGEANVLTRDPVLLLEPTGGSSGAEKLVPYTAGLKRQFQRALAAWVYDTMCAIPEVRRGKAYWSISPPAQRARQTGGGVPIGFDDDSHYLGSWQRWAISRVLAAPPSIARLGSIENFHYATLACLLAESDLALISIWSPTFLTTLLADLPQLQTRICDDLQAGRIRPPHPQEEPRPFEFPVRRGAQRARELRRIFASSSDGADALAQCWPRLALISCWGDGASAMQLANLRMRFPQVRIQPKGLLATEGVVSIPWSYGEGSVLTIRSHFFEFIRVAAGKTADGEQPLEEHDAAETLLAHQLQTGHYYRILLTTAGGFYRYDLGDIVEAVGLCGQCPRLRFIERQGAVSDLVGEKLHESHVQQAIMAMAHVLGVKPEFALLAPAAGQPPHYRLHVAISTQAPNAETLWLAAGALEQSLSANPQYRDAVQLGQLNPLDIRLWRLSPNEAWRVYEDRCRRDGRKCGDIKPAVLDRRLDWDAEFSRRERSGDYAITPGRNQHPGNDLCNLAAHTKEKT